MKVPNDVAPSKLMEYSLQGHAKQKGNLLCLQRGSSSEATADIRSTKNSPEPPVLAHPRPA
jgi:hypothetical protein